MPDVVDIQSEITKKKVMIDEFFERIVVTDPIKVTVIPTVKVLNIWEVPEQFKRIIIEKRENKRKRKEKRGQRCKDKGRI